ncbi:MAG TPA: hypothetical protein DCY05_09775 [Spirochaetaceae bacterium]|nr:hypothetical protein [Spirochaetaceae bacterium]
MDRDEKQAVRTLTGAALKGSRNTTSATATRQYHQAASGLRPAKIRAAWKYSRLAASTRLLPTATTAYGMVWRMASNSIPPARLDWATIQWLAPGKLVPLPNSKTENIRLAR